MTSTTRQVQNRGKVTSPIDTGLMRSSHVARIVVYSTRVVGTVTVLTDYSIPVHEGWHRTAPIRPKRGRALKFKAGGQTVIVKSVKTPVRVAGRPWLRLALFQVAKPRGFTVRAY